ncbi:MAG: hypothetical protein ABIR39_09545 [Nocardioides sp.]|uniref:Nmad2 family putative nucleotide modification protein n=1 Tax=Nocardioides sp. TaxID=35761 RepID=UPI003264B915
MSTISSKPSTSSDACRPSWDDEQAGAVPTRESTSVTDATFAVSSMSNSSESGPWITGSPVATNRVFSYIVAYDSGFAPNPFHGLLTLATCKPRIRQGAAVNDIVIGISSRSERIVYAMQVSQIIGFDEYWADPRYAARRPQRDSPRIVNRTGDNIYEPSISGYRQCPSFHSKDDGSEDLGHKARDTGVDRVLVSERFSYWGGSGPRLPEQLSFLQIGIGHRVNFSPEQIAEVGGWFADQPGGVLGAPAMWKKNDDSWRQP